MSDNPRHDDAPDPPSGAAPTRADVVARWTQVLIDSAYAPLSRKQIRAHLTDWLDVLADGTRADEVGEWLVRARFTGQDSLRRTVEVLAGALPALTGDPDRAATALAGVAAGYANALRRQVFTEQEEVRTSLLAALEQAQHDLHDSEARFRQVFVSSAVGIAIFDGDGAVVEVNPALVRMLRHAPDTADEATGASGADAEHVFAPGDLAALRAAWTAIDEVRFEQQFTGPNGDPMWTNVALSTVRDADGQPRYRVAVIEDVTEQRVLRDYLRHQALHDVLTGLPNRQSFLPKLEEVLGKPGSITLCYLDVDSVAIVNDGIGYEAGDELLKVVAGRLTTVVADEKATVARIGGDEFVVLIEDSPDTPSISALAAAIDEALAEPVQLSGHGVAVTAGMGFVRTSARGVDAMALLRQAHSTLRRAESGGKGQWGIYDAGEDARDRKRLSLIATMPGALEFGEIAIDYRPVARPSGDPIAHAARLRWDEAEFGVVGHEECLEFADALGLSGHLGEWLLEEACAFAAVEGAPVVVRLSSDQSRDPDLAAVVRTALDRSSLAPQRLWLSLDCRALPGGLDVVEDNLTTLADMGVRRLLHGFSCGLPELALVERHVLHGVELPAPPDEPLARRAVELVVPLVRATGALVISDLPGADAAVRP
ncbi:MULTISPECIES: diguanylate cyclase domain-containing protein [unclassified Saccharothrix]|uniref:diguanylate cyclase domain-containing protein n=1 Tax=unclassified Saccharothrix TaxID=2593673 RepID=UPI00307DF3E6